MTDAEVREALSLLSRSVSDLKDLHRDRTEPAVLLLTTLVQELDSETRERVFQRLWQRAAEAASSHPEAASDWKGALQLAKTLSGAGSEAFGALHLIRGGKADDPA